MGLRVYLGVNPQKIGSIRSDGRFNDGVMAGGILVLGWNRAGCILWINVFRNIAFYSTIHSVVST